MSTINYTNISDTKKYWLNNIAPNYFDMNDVNNYNISTFGYINELMGATTEDGFNAMAISRREFYPTTAQFDSSLFTMAALHQINIPLASPSICRCALIISQNDIINNSTFDSTNGIYSCNIDSVLKIYAGDISFMLDYPIQINSKRNNATGEFTHTMYYDTSISNSLNDNPSDRYISNRIILDNGTKYVIMFINTIRQLELEEISNVLIKDSTILTTTMDINYSGNLANFEIFYKANSSDDEMQLTKVILNGTLPTEPYVQYEYMGDDKIRLYFTYNDIFVPQYNSEIICRLYKSLGSGGNFNQYDGDLLCSSNSERYPYNSNMTILGRINGSAYGGADRVLTEKFRRQVQKAYTTNNTITTSTDLRLQFEELAGDVENTSILFLKKRDDALIRLFGAYTIFKDQNDNIVPSNTLDTTFKKSDFVEDVEVGESNRFTIPTGTVFEYLNESSFIIHPTLRNDKPTSILDLISSRKSNTINTATESAYFTNPFLIGVNIYPNTIGYYLNSIDSTVPIAYEYVNDSSSNQFIAGALSVQRNSMVGTNFYKFSIKLVPASNLDTTYIFTENDFTLPENQLIAPYGGQVIREELYTDSAGITYIRFTIAYDRDISQEWSNLPIGNSTGGFSAIGYVDPDATALSDNLVYVAFPDNTTSIYHHSTDGETWEVRNIIESGTTSYDVLSVTSYHMTGGVSNTSVWATLKNSNKLLYNSASMYFAERTTGSVLRDWSKLVNDNDTMRILMVSSSHNIAAYGSYGSDQLIEMPISSTDTDRWTDIIFNNGEYYAFGYNSATEDAVLSKGSWPESGTLTFSDIAINTTYRQWSSIAINDNGTIALCSKDGRHMAYSNDMTTWTETDLSSSTRSDNSNIVFMGDKVAILGSSSIVKYSSDYITWSEAVLELPSRPGSNPSSDTPWGNFSLQYGKLFLPTGTRIIEGTLELIDFEIAYVQGSNYNSALGTPVTGYKMNYEVGETFVQGSLIASKRINDLGNLFAIGDINKIFHSANIYTLFTLQDYDKDNNAYIMEAYLGTNDYIDYDEKIIFTSGIYTSAGVVSEPVSMDAKDLFMEINTLFRNPDFNDTNKYTAYAGFGAFSLTNSYVSREDEKFNLIYPLRFIRSVASFSPIDVNDVDNRDFIIHIGETPMVGAEWSTMPNNYTYFINKFSLINDQLNYAFLLLENGFSIDTKFYNTYGKSRYYQVGNNSTGMVALDNVKCSFKFGIKLATVSSTDEFVQNFRNYVKSYIEADDRIETGTRDLYILNMISSLKDEFTEIDYIEYYGMNIYDNSAQKVIGPDLNVSISSIPEFVNLDMLYDSNGVGYPNITITFL